MKDSTRLFFFDGKNYLVESPISRDIILTHMNYLT